MSNENTPTQLMSIIHNLKACNRKERDYLMKFALCESLKNPGISHQLWNLLAPDSHTTRPSADEMFVGMDYHLNWLYAALAAPHPDSLCSNQPRLNRWEHTATHTEEPHNSQPIQGNQQDVDLLVAWIDPASGQRLHLVVIEAKLDSGWNSQQFKSKVERLTLIRDDDNTPTPDIVDWRFLLLSPNACPQGHAFDPQNFAGPRYEWIMDPFAPHGEQRLWHEKLPIRAQLPVEELRHVKRVSEDNEHWTTEPSLKRETP